MDALHEVTHSANVRLNDEDSTVVIIDQTKLPNELVYLPIDKVEDAYQAIKTLQVRGAPAIGIFAGYCMYIFSKKWKDLSYEEFKKKYEEVGAYLNSSRPTAVNLSWALRRMKKIVEENADIPTILTLLKKEAVAIHEEDIAMCKAISEYGLSLLKPGDGIITHCNTGPLATSRYGTAIGPMLLGNERGLDFRVYADETRPLLQGARLTSYELQRAGVDVTLICDNMASIVMKNGWVDYVFFGCDRIAANGDVANKIGSSGLAIIAKHYGIPVYSLGPSSTIDLNTPTGDDIKIELRDPDEIKTMWYEKPMALPETKCYNPSFDVTDHTLLSGIITEKGIVRPPFDVNLKKMFGDNNDK
ncbi:MAG: S-methyl-5-thioribose-1-phosphate isomerase [Erysipelotrichaceae bacterium]|nr:S-methyl-5-thioribose-1-phosphate isomerase [Erysipelotrichaceae bacterium]